LLADSYLHNGFKEEILCGGHQIGPLFFLRMPVEIFKSILSTFTLPIEKYPPDSPLSYGRLAFASQSVSHEKGRVNRPAFCTKLKIYLWFSCS